jgi:hypothetical protein
MFFFILASAYPTILNMLRSVLLVFSATSLVGIVIFEPVEFNGFLIASGAMRGDR